MSEAHPQNPHESEALLQKLAQLVELSPDVRFGQLLANLGFLAEARAGQSLWDIEDPQLLQVLEQHRDELAQRTQPGQATRTHR
jgi:hypothetical protein